MASPPQSGASFQLAALREEIRACPSRAAVCRTLTRFKRKVWPAVFDNPSVRHPLLPDDVPRGPVRIFVVGIQPGNAVDTSRVTEYLRANANESPLGWYSGRVLTEWLGRAVLRAAMIDRTGLPVDHLAVHELLTELDAYWPLGSRDPLVRAQARIDALMRDFRRLAGVYGTNLVKCHTIGKLPDDSIELEQLANACATRYVVRELEAAQPDVVMPVGTVANRMLERLLATTPWVDFRWHDNPGDRLSNH